MKRVQGVEAAQGKHYKVCKHLIRSGANLYSAKAYLDERNKNRRANRRGEMRRGGKF